MFAEIVNMHKSILESVEIISIGSEEMKCLKLKF